MMIQERYFINKSVYLNFCGKRLYIGSIIHKQQVIYVLKQQFKNSESDFFIQASLNISLVSLKIDSLTNGYADTVARELVKVFLQHSYIPQTILSDLGTNFSSELMSDLASLLEVKLKRASQKYPQTI